jgi:hypothetical protein
MSAPPPDDMRKLRHTAFAARHPVDSMLARWQAINDDAARLARLAALTAPEYHPHQEFRNPADFVGALANAVEWQRELAWQAVQDIEAMLQSGMSALDVLADRGKDPRVPALALWREVDAAQRAVLAMLLSVAEQTDLAAPSAPVA